MTARILAASDFSEASDEALRQARERALASSAKLAVCHAIPNVLEVHALFPQVNQTDALQMSKFEASVRAALGETRPSHATAREPGNATRQRLAAVTMPSVPSAPISNCLKS